MAGGRVVTVRQFPDNAEVDQWISTHFLGEANANASPVFDQLKAATADSVNRFQSAAPGLVADGLARWAFLDIPDPDPDRSKMRGAVRQVMAAESAGILSLCPHTQQIRPLMLVCDPPVIVCTSCFASRKAVIEALGHCWNHECDRCGVHVQQLTPVTIGGLGYITVAGHVCDWCAAEDQRLAPQTADHLVVVGNRRARRGGAR
jgi:hypothetical protein